jgi:hypothetical protein
LILWIALAANHEPVFNSFVYRTSQKGAVFCETTCVIHDNHFSLVWDLLTEVRSIWDVVLQVNGYGFVVTPSPKPGVDHTPAMTWGVVDGTPFRLDAGDTPQMAVGKCMCHGLCCLFLAREL